MIRCRVTSLEADSSSNRNENYIGNDCAKDIDCDGEVEGGGEVEGDGERDCERDFVDDGDIHVQIGTQTVTSNRDVVCVKHLLNCTVSYDMVFLVYSV